MPEISVILTSFNHVDFISEAIDSVLSQTFTDFELIIWDDASSDGSWSVIDKYDDPRIIKFRNDIRRRGVYGINKSITEIAKGDFIAIHHSDDIWVSDKLEKQLKFLKSNEDYGAVFTNVKVVSESGEEVDDPDNYYAHIFRKQNRSRFEWLNYFITQGNVLCHPSVLIRKKCYDECGVYRYGLAQLGDFDMWVRLCMKYEIHIMPDKLVKFRSRNSAANTSGNTLASRSRINYEFHVILKEIVKLQLSDIVKVFPGAEKYKTKGIGSAEFVWAMMLIEFSNFSLGKLIALDILFNLLNDPGHAKKINELYGFSALDFVELSSKYGIANLYNSDHENQLSVMDSYRRERDEAVTRLNRITSSKLWKITKPFRLLLKKPRN